MLDLFEQAIVMHLIGDWVFQNHWMAENKTNLKHPAAWIHGGIHFLLMTVVLGWVAGLVLAVAHMFIDTRIPFRAWRTFFGMTSEDPMGRHVAIWTDQVFHLLCIAAWIQFVMPHF